MLSWENKTIKTIIIDFSGLHIFDGSFFLKSMFALRDFESVIMVPKVRTDRNYCYSDYRLNMMQTQQVWIRETRRSNKMNLSIFNITSCTAHEWTMSARASFRHAPAMQHGHAHVSGTSCMPSQNVSLYVRLLKPNVYSVLHLLY